MARDDRLKIHIRPIVELGVVLMGTVGLIMLFLLALQRYFSERAAPAPAWPVQSATYTLPPDGAQPVEPVPSGETVAK